MCVEGGVATAAHMQHHDALIRACDCKAVAHVASRASEPCRYTSLPCACRPAHLFEQPLVQGVLVVRQQLGHEPRVPQRAPGLLPRRGAAQHGHHAGQRQLHQRGRLGVGLRARARGGAGGRSTGGAALPAGGPPPAGACRIMSKCEGTRCGCALAWGHAPLAFTPTRAARPRACLELCDVLLGQHVERLLCLAERRQRALQLGRHLRGAGAARVAVALAAGGAARGQSGAGLKKQGSGRSTPGGPACCDERRVGSCRRGGPGTRQTATLVRCTPAARLRWRPPPRARSWLRPR